MSSESKKAELMASLRKVEHPEIAVSIVDLGMIQDVQVEGETARVFIALPMLEIPINVRDAIVGSLLGPVARLGLNLQPFLVEMTQEARTDFFRAAKENWKGSI